MPCTGEELYLYVFNAVNHRGGYSYAHLELSYLPKVIELAVKPGLEIRLALEPVVLTGKLYRLASDFTVVYTEELRHPCSGVATGVKGTEHTKVASRVNGNCWLSGHVACIPAMGFCSAFI